MTFKPLEGSIIDLFDNWAAREPDRIAAEWEGETLTYSELRNASLHVSKALLAAGVPPRTKVPILTKMSLEMLPAVIGVLRAGSCYVPMDVAAWSHSKIEAALKALPPSIALVTCSCEGIKLPTLTLNFQKDWLQTKLEDVANLCSQLDEIRRSLRDDDLVWIIFTSGTTGKPKGVQIYHRAIYSLVTTSGGGLVDEMKRGHEERGMRCLLAYSIAFDGCAGIVWTTLTVGGALIMAAPSTFPTIASTCDVLNLAPSMLNALDPTGPYDKVRYIFLGAEAPNLDVARQWIRLGKKVINTYGPSETTVIISFGEISPAEEPSFGEILPGVTVTLVDENLQERSDYGEVMIAGPGLAAGYLNNAELTAKKFIRWHEKDYYRTGDLARRTEKGQLIFAGRVDSLVKNRGFLINLEVDVEPALLSFPGVKNAVAFIWRDKLVGCVQPKSISIEALRQFLTGRYDHYIVPDKLLSMESFPLNANSKVDRLALKKTFERQISEKEYDLETDMDGTTAYDALRVGFSKLLSVHTKELDRESSFIKLGGNSLVAIRLSNFLKKRGFPISAVPILKLDTIGRLEETVQKSQYSEDLEHGMDSASSIEEAPLTGLMELMVKTSLQNPKNFAIIGLTRYTGDAATTPSPSELRNAFLKAMSSHSIFQTRINIEKLSLSDLGRINLDWDEVITTQENFEQTCKTMEEKAWADLMQITAANIEVPYCAITCISVPNHGALAFVTRAHHFLTDVFSSAILTQDMERALAGETVPQGPAIKDFCIFMDRHKQKNLQRAVDFFHNMAESVPLTNVVQAPRSQSQSPASTSNFDLTRLHHSTSIQKSTLDESAHEKGVTPATIAYAAWALFLHKITQWNALGFSVSLSGRTIPWAHADSIVGPLLNRIPLAFTIPAGIAVYDWLLNVHKIVLDAAEFDGLSHSLPDSIMGDGRTNRTQMQCLLDMPPPSSRWSFVDRQKHGYMLYWYVYQVGDMVETTFELQPDVDLEWAKEVARVPAAMLKGLVEAGKHTLVEDLMKYNAL